MELCDILCKHHASCVRHCPRNRNALGVQYRCPRVFKSTYLCKYTNISQIRTWMTDSLSSSCGHFKTDFVQTGIGYHLILDCSILEVKSLPRSTTVERINCRSEVNSMDSEFPARNHFPFSWHSPPVQKKGRHEEDIIRYLLMIQNISAAIYIL